MKLTPVCVESAKITGQELPIDFKCSMLTFNDTKLNRITLAGKKGKVCDQLMAQDEYEQCLSSIEVSICILLVS